MSNELWTFATIVGVAMGTAMGWYIGFQLWEALKGYFNRRK